jgi:uncharacterized protein YdhG (YjbR/CyaY superfamily)
MEPTRAPETIDEYIAGFPPDIQQILEKLRSAIREAAPDATERISYRMPAFDLRGILVYFAANKNHIGFYPTASPIVKFKDELSQYHFSKGAIRFPIDKPLPYNLISRIVKFRQAENLAKAEQRRKKKTI